MSAEKSTVAGWQAVGGQRLDVMVSQHCEIGRRRAAQWVREGRVLVDDRRARPGDAPTAESHVRVDLTEAPVAVAILPAARIVLARGATTILNKRAGAHTHKGISEPSVARYLETLGHGAAQIGDRPEEAGIVHRLDRDTSGVLIAATDAETFQRFREAFKNHRVEKEYLALVGGHPAPSFEINVPLARRGARVVAATVGDKSLTAKTRANVLEQGRGWALVHATSSTGAPHQIRAHLAMAGFALIGDQTYAGQHALSDRSGHFLHALRVRLASEIDATAPVPGDFLLELAARRHETAQG
ncbi:MAG: 23S rRNA pseudouridine1911/1915/1917 synthase [Candidatus Binatia bacterium]